MPYSETQRAISLVHLQVKNLIPSRNKRDRVLISSSSKEFPGLSSQHKHMRRLTMLLPNPTSKSMMPRPLVMLAQQISAVIVAIGRAHDDVNMIFVMLFVLGKGLAGLMIELDQQHRAMDAVIENAVFFHAADLAYGRSVGRRVRRKI